MMVDRVINILSAIGIAWGAWAGVSYLVPASLHMSVESVYVYDTPYGKAPELVVVREINRDFLGSYSVVVRRAETLEIVCDGSAGPFQYRAGAALPETVFLDWWVGEPCNLDSGRYTMQTIWQIDRWPLREAVITVNTPEFIVEGKIP